MQIDLPNKSKSLLSVTDLTLLAPIKQGLIPAMDSRTYESRLRLLLRTLNTSRVSSREADPTPLIADPVDRIRAIHSFRLAIVGEAPRQLLLSVAFDGGWEPYMRRIWHDLGPLLDVIFCNCDGYLDSYSHDYSAYARWVRSAQVETEFFYNASPLTVNDLHYFRREAASQQTASDPKRPTSLDKNLFHQALPALTALYRLTDMYPPLDETADGQILWRAARSVLKELAKLLDGCSGRHQVERLGRNPTERAAIRWFRSLPPTCAKVVDDPAQWDPSKVQGGIIKPYRGLTHGCLLLVELKNAAAARDMLDYLRLDIERSSQQAEQLATAAPFVNLAFTNQGLPVIGVDSGTIDLLPYEFREGMAARAGILGDLRWNHPTNWFPPERNWPKREDDPDRVELSSVHAIVQFTCRDETSPQWQEVPGNESHPLWKAVNAFSEALVPKGVRVLSVQSMQRFPEADNKHSRGHFGFVDGISQPRPKAPAKQGAKPTPANRPYTDEVMLGDLLLGYTNSHDDPPLTGKLWDDSTFLVVRKLKQNVEVLEQVLERAKKISKRDDLVAKFMGREINGKILLQLAEGKNPTDNDFDYSNDPEGRICPFQSHIRRANPRARRDDQREVPRIIRRGMSYGPRVGEAEGEADRGLFFMGYNASIAEQFEVIQAWLSGANSSHPDTYSALRDPFVGVPQEGDPNVFVFHGSDGPLAVDLPPDDPIVKLEWGLYAFVPSIKAVTELRDIADAAARDEKEQKKPAADGELDKATARLALEALKGDEIIRQLRLLEQYQGFDVAKERWKIVLEDISARMKGYSQVVWTAIRQLHGGVLRTPYGVLVCSKLRVEEVFSNKHKHYTATGYAERMRASFGEIYLGKDDEGAGSAYDLESCRANTAIMNITREEAFETAINYTQDALRCLIGSKKSVTLEVKDLTDAILAGISRDWFGLPDDHFVVKGGWHWRDEPTCPGHFHSPSRYMFQPNPGPQAALTGERHGQALKNAVTQFVAQHRDCGTTPSGTLGEALFDGYPDTDQLASTLIGVMMGFLPTVDGNIRGVLYEWVNDRSLWDHQLAYLAEDDAITLRKAEQILMPKLEKTLLLRPVPELAWRTALRRHSLGTVEVLPGELIVASIVSATQECLNTDEKEGLYILFGGNRREKSHPTHACPGYNAALGVMLGILSGLLGLARLAPTFSPMALRVSLRPGH